MTGSVSTDPRQRVRDAMHRVIQLTPDQWHEPSLFVFRNRVLDLTGSDARPFVELLVDAWERFGERFPKGPLPAVAWDTAVAPLVMQWTSSRFLQPEMARWAIGCWGYALGRIVEPERATPPSQSEPMANMAARLNARVAATGKSAWKGSAWRPAVPTRATPPLRTASPPPAITGSGTTWRAPRPAVRPAGPPLNPWIARSLVGVLALMIGGLIVRVALSPGKPTINSTMRFDSTRMDTVKALATTPPSPPPVSARGVDSIVPIAGVTLGMAGDPLPRGVRVVAPQLTGGVMITAPERPGVPSVTRTLLPNARDSSQLQFIEPVRRAGGESPQRRAPSAPAPAPMSLAYDEVRLTTGRTLRGRVEIVRAGTIIFREMRSGLRYELSKDDVDAVVTEFGTIVRFRGEGTAPAPIASSAPHDTRTARSAPGEILRRRGVGGRYRVRYDAATAVGSPSCTEVWTKAPNTIDFAVVRHIPGADTLSVAFEGGDQFPSTIDPNGYFASTFRIVPDQARTMTALTTRLSGRFTPDGGVTITVNLVFYRRLRTSDVTCNVTVNAAGQRENQTR